MPRIINSNLLYPELSYAIVGCCFQSQKELGRFCREKQYGDNLEKQFQKAGISCKREYEIKNFNQYSPDGNKVDFLIHDIIILEIKAKRFITKEDYYQVQRYLHGANLELGILVNFRDSYINPKRVLNSGFRLDSDHSV